MEKNTVTCVSDDIESLSKQDGVDDKRVTNLQIQKTAILHPLHVGFSCFTFRIQSF